MPIVTATVDAMSFDPDPIDVGLFGPGSVAWRVHADPTMVIGGIRALLLQSLHPLAMAGVVEHTEYRDRLWERLRDTAQYVATTVFGTTAEAEAAAARVRGLHRHVHGIDPVTGLAYDANDPELLAWVHDVEVQSFLVAYRHFAGGLSKLDADRYVDEMARAGALVGLPADAAPHSVAELDAQMEAFRPQLRATPGSRDVVRILLWPPLPLLARPLWISLFAGAVATIPGDLRRMHPFPPQFLPVDLSLSIPAAAISFVARRLLPGSPTVRAARERVAGATPTGG
jgi:uncharacterized protein (DUF2236 family)